MISKLKYLIFIISFSFAYSQDIDLLLQGTHLSQVNCIAWSPDETMFATASSDETIKLWDVQTGLMLKNFVGHKEEVVSTCFSESSDTLFSACTDGTVYFWNTKKGNLFKSFSYDLSVLEILYYAQKNLLLCRMLDNRLTAIDASAGKKTTLTPLEKFKIICFCISKDGSLIFSTENSEIYSYNLNQRNDAPKLITKFDGEVIGIKTDENAKFFAFKTVADTIYIWDNEIKSIKRTYFSDLPKFALSPNGKFLAFYSIRATSVKLFNIEDNSLIKEYGMGMYVPQSIAFSPDNNYLCVADEIGNTYFVDLHNYSKLKIVGISQTLRGLAMSMRRNIIASALSDSIIRIWRTDEGGSPQTFPTKVKDIWSIALHPTENKIAVGGVGFDNSNLQIIDFNTLETVARLVFTGGIINNVNFSEDGGKLFFSSEDTIYINDFKKNALIKIQTAQKQINSLSVHPSKPLLVSTGRTSIQIWNYETIGNSVPPKPNYAEFQDNSGIYSSVLTQSGDTLISGNEKGEIKIWSINNKKILSTNDRLHSGRAVRALAVSQDSKLIASGGDDNSIKIWDISNFNIIENGNIRSPHNSAVSRLNFYNDSILISAGTDGLVKIWKFNQNKLILMLVGIGSRDWATIAPNGNFDASPEAMKMLHWVENNKPVRIDAYFDKKFSPRLLKSVFAGVLNYPVSDDLAVAGLKLPPVVSIETSSVTDSTSNPKFNLKFDASATNVEIEEIKVYNNSKLVFSEILDVPIFELKNKIVEIELLSGQNELKIIAMDLNRTESHPKILQINKTGKIAFANTYILTIGVGEYEDAALNLKYPVSDASAVAQTINDIHLSFDKDGNHNESYQLSDNEATVESVRELLGKIAQKTKPEDIFVFYYAGHGMVIDCDSAKTPDFYLVLHNVGSAEKNEICSKSISTKEIYKLMLNIKANKQLFIFDACQSGQVTSELIEEERILAKIGRDLGLTAISSSSESANSFEHDSLGHGIFTYVLLQGLKGWAANSNFDIFVYELSDYLKGYVPILSQRYARTKQRPATYNFGQNFKLGTIPNK